MVVVRTSGSAPAADAEGGLPSSGSLKRYVPQVVAALVATLGGFSLGSVIGWNAPASLPIANLHFNGDEKEAESTVAWSGSIMPLGACAALVLMSFAVDYFGRKIVMLAITIPFLASWLILAFWETIPALLVGRFIGGFCGGSFTVLTPLYIGEISQKEIRGMLSVCFQLLLVIGIMFSYALGMAQRLDFLSYMNVIPNVAFFILMLFMPESPTFLLTKGKKEDALKSLQWFRGKGCDIEGELRDIEASVEAATARKGSFKNMFSQKASKKAIGIAMLLMFCQQLSGINIVMFYTTDIFRQAKAGLNADLCTVIIGLTQVLATSVSASIVDRVGRRILLLVSHTGMGICLVILGVYFHIHDRGLEIAENLGWLAVLCVCVYMISFSLGCGPLPWTMLGELFPPEIKGLAGSLCSFVNWLLVFIVAKTFYDIKNVVYSEGCYWLYAGFCFTSTVLIYFFVIETKNKTLEKIQTELGAN